MPSTPVKQLVLLDVGRCNFAKKVHRCNHQTMSKLQGKCNYVGKMPSSQPGTAKSPNKIWLFPRLFVSLQAITILKHFVNMETTRRKRTREEVRAAVRETIRRKQEWIEQTNKEFEMIRKGELKVEDLYTF